MEFISYSADNAYQVIYFAVCNYCFFSENHCAHKFINLNMVTDLLHSFNSEKLICETVSGVINISSKFGHAACLLRYVPCLVAGAA